VLALATVLGIFLTARYPNLDHHRPGPDQGTISEQLADGDEPPVDALGVIEAVDRYRERSDPDPAPVVVQRCVGARRSDYPSSDERRATREKFDAGPCTWNPTRSAPKSPSSIGRRHGSWRSSS